MKRNSLIAALLATGAVLAGIMPAQAEAGATSGGFKQQMLFARIDGNHNGKIDAAEITALRERMFKRIDRNSDGQISTQEQAKAQERIERGANAMQLMMAERFDALDSDGDGMVSKAEYAAGGDRFKLLDTNHDGALEQDELVKLCLLAAKGCN